MSLTVECILRLLLACLCGGAVGFERTKRLKEAGIRTHCIIASAAALLMLVSKYGFADLELAQDVYYAGTKGTDPARVVAQVISGISFLGAGVIFKNGNSVKGLTTAAGIWATAAIGISIGGGMYLLGILVTLMVVGIQLVFHRFSIGNDAFSETDVRIVAQGNEAFKKWLYDSIDNKEIQALSVRVDRDEQEQERYTVSFRTRQQMTHRELTAELEKIPGITSIMM